MITMTEITKYISEVNDVLSPIRGGIIELVEAEEEKGFMLVHKTRSYEYRLIGMWPCKFISLEELQASTKKVILPYIEEREEQIKNLKTLLGADKKVV